MEIGLREFNTKGAITTYIRIGEGMKFINIIQSTSINNIIQIIYGNNIVNKNIVDEISILYKGRLCNNNFTLEEINFQNNDILEYRLKLKINNINIKPIINYSTNIINQNSNTLFIVSFFSYNVVQHSSNLTIRKNILQQIPKHFLELAINHRMKLHLILIDSNFLKSENERETPKQLYNYMNCESITSKSRSNNSNLTIIEYKGTLRKDLSDEYMHNLINIPSIENKNIIFQIPITLTTIGINVKVPKLYRIKYLSDQSWKEYTEVFDYMISFFEPLLRNKIIFFQSFVGDIIYQSERTRYYMDELNYIRRGMINKSHNGNETGKINNK